MKYLLKGADVYINGQFLKRDILVKDGFICDICESLNDSDAVLFDLKDKYIFHNQKLFLAFHCLFANKS